MSVYINGDKKSLRRTVNLPTSCAAFTVCGFVKAVSGQTSPQEPHLLYVQDSDGANAETLYLGGTGNLQLFGADSYGTNNTAAAGTLTAGGGSGANWYFVGLRGTAAGAGGLKATFKPVGSGSMVHQTTTNSPGTKAVSAIQIGDLPFGSTYWADALYAHWMVYDRALSDAEMSTQAGQAAPANTTNLISYHSFSGTDVNAAMVPTTGSGTFSFFNSAPLMSTDNPVFSGNPVYSGSLNLPTAQVLAYSGIPPVLYKRFFRN